MPDGDVAASFVVDYELSAEDVWESAIVGRSVARSGKSLMSQWGWPTLSLVLTGVIVFVNEKTVGCFIPTATPGQAAPIQVFAWQCQPTSPNGLLWQNTWLFATVGAVWLLTLIDLGKAWVRMPRWYARKWMKTHEVLGRYRYEIAADGITIAAPDGTIAYTPWPVFTAVRETRERFFLSGRRYSGMWVLPKRGLSDQSSVRRLGEFLRESAGREAPPT